MVKIKIHRGTNQIGGTITEIYTENTHIFIDFGSELSVAPEESTDADMVKMIKNAKCDAVLFSHYHGDHIGLMGMIPEKDIDGKTIQLGIGAVARKVLINIHNTLINDSTVDVDEHKKMLSLLQDDTRWIDFKSQTDLQIGDFHITTVRVDHSAYDAYMFIIEAEGKTIVHTGDYRTHGRLGNKLFPDLEEALAGKTVDILLTEGTMMERQESQFNSEKNGAKNEKVITEKEMEDQAYQLLEKPENKWAFLLCSSTNVESLASFHNAALKLGRPFIVNYYVYNQILEYRKSAGKDNTEFKFWKTYKFENMYKTNDKLGGLTQPEYMMKNGFVMLIGKNDSYRKRMEYFRDKDPILIYSMWDGYVNKEKYPDTYDEKLGTLVSDWRCRHLHTSGHATVEDIKKMIETVHPRLGVIPIHTTRKGDFDKLGIEGVKAILLADGDEYEI